MSIQRLPAGRDSQIFRSICRVLCGNAALARVVKTWRLPEPDDEGWGVIAAAPLAYLSPISPDECPAIRVTPLGGPIAWCDERSVNARVGARVEAVVSSARAADALDLWELGMEALRSDAASPDSDSSGAPIPVRTYLWNRSVLDPSGNPEFGEGPFAFGFASADVQVTATVVVKAGNFEATVFKPA